MAAGDPGQEIDNDEFLKRCTGLATKYELQHLLFSPDSNSRAQFDGALKLAENRDLLGPGGPELAKRRVEFANELSDAVDRVGEIRDIAVGQWQARERALEPDLRRPQPS